MNIDQTIVSVLGTYALHSTLAIVCVWLVTGPLKLLREPKAVRGTWKLALFLPFFSSAFQLLAGYVPPAFYAFAMAPAVAEEPIILGTPVVESAGPAFVAPAWTVVLAALWAVGASIGAWKLAKGELALRRMLKGREEVLDDHAVDALIDLRQRADVKRRIALSVSDKLSTPVAVGRSEIVLSQHALEQLPPKQMQGVIGHELAHLEARDPWWSRAIAVVEAACFFQPLNFWAKRRHRDAAELAADDWARSLGVQGDELARALAEIAATSPETPAPAWAQAAKGGSLVRRVERLLAEPSSSRTHLDAADQARAQGMPRLAAALGALAMMALFAPRIGFASPPPAAEPTVEIAAARAQADASVFIAHHGRSHRHSQHLFVGDADGGVMIVNDGEVMAMRIHDGPDVLHIEVPGELAEAAREVSEEVQRELERELGPEFAARIQAEVFEELEREGVFIEWSADHQREMTRAQRRQVERARRDAKRAAKRARREAERAREQADRARDRAERARERAEELRERQEAARERMQDARERAEEQREAARERAEEQREAAEERREEATVRPAAWSPTPNTQPVVAL